GRKHRAHFEENSGLGGSDDDLPALPEQVSTPLVQFDNRWRLAIEKLLHRELAAGVRLVAVGELAPAAGAGPERVGAGAFSFAHRLSASGIGCFAKKSHMRSLADTFLVVLPSTFTVGSRPGQVCPPPSITTKTTSAPSLPPP